MSQGNRKTTCTFTIVLQGEEIDNVNINCSPKPKKQIKVTDFVYTTKTLKMITLSFTVQKSKVRVTRSSVETVPCPLGFVRVCNEAFTTLESVAICPASEASEEEAECSCLQKRLVEEDLCRSLWTLMFVPVLFSPTMLSMSGMGTGENTGRLSLATVETVFNVHFDFQGYWSCNRYSEEF